MKITNLTVKNKKINFKDQVVEINGPGVYLISGDNGVGKTTILESILFENNAICFCSEEHQRLYNEERYNLFAYLPQGIPDYDVSVQEYLSKKGFFSKDEYFQLAKALKMDYIDLDSKINKLSGGERVKLGIISVFMKNTPYIFLDEPTNHLDNDGVGALIDLIRAEAEKKTILIVSHDKRLRFDFKTYNITIEPGTIIQKGKKEADTNIGIGANINGNDIRKHFMYKGIAWINIIAFFIIAIVLDGLVYVNHNKFVQGYSYENGEYEPDALLTYKADYFYSDLNTAYAKGSGLMIDSYKYDTTILMSDIPAISNIEGVDSIFVFDYLEFEEKINKCVLNDDTIYAAAIPKLMFTDYYDIMVWSIGIFGDLISGRYPDDYSNEICIPYHLLSYWFPLTDENSDGASMLGNEIYYNGEKYILVGILNGEYNLCIQSFDKEIGGTVYTYDADTFAAFMKKYTSEEIMETTEMLILTQPGKEKMVLDSLMTAFPAENYISSEFINAFEKQYNKEYMQEKIIPFNVVISVIVSLFVLLILKNQIKADGSKIADFNNYYISKTALRRFYVGNAIVKYGVLLIFCFGLNYYMNRSFRGAGTVLLIDALIIVLPSCIYMCKVLKNGYKNTD